MALPKLPTSSDDWEVWPTEALALPSAPLLSPEATAGLAPMPYIHVEDDEVDEPQLKRSRPGAGRHSVPSPSPSTGDLIGGSPFCDAGPSAPLLSPEATAGRREEGLNPH